jgi:hypothetical protein
VCRTGQLHTPSRYGAPVAVADLDVPELMLGDRNVAKAIAGQPAGSDTNAIVGSRCRAAVGREIPSRGGLAALANARVA